MAVSPDYEAPHNSPDRQRFWGFVSNRHMQTCPGMYVYSDDGWNRIASRCALSVGHAGDHEPPPMGRLQIDPYAAEAMLKVLIWSRTKTYD